MKFWFKKTDNHAPSLQRQIKGAIKKYLEIYQYQRDYEPGEEEHINAIKARLREFKRTGCYKGPVEFNGYRKNENRQIESVKDCKLLVDYITLGLKKENDPEIKEYFDKMIERHVSSRMEICIKNKKIKNLYIHIPLPPPSLDWKHVNLQF